jgi:acylpyruvate hydrolase
MNKVLQKTKKIICLLRNYEEHAKEMKSVVPKNCNFFLKPTTSILYSENKNETLNIEIPKDCELDHEGIFISINSKVELGFFINKKGRDIKVEDAMSYVLGYCLTIDMTARNKQAEAKKIGFPWSISKGYDTFCPLSDFIPNSKVKDPHNLQIWLKVNGEIKQNDNTKNKVFKIPQMISQIR